MRLNRAWTFEGMPGGALPPVEAAAKSLQLERKRNSETVKSNESVRDAYRARQLFEPTRARSPDPSIMLLLPILHNGKGFQLKDPKPKAEIVEGGANRLIEDGEAAEPSCRRTANEVSGGSQRRYPSHYDRESRHVSDRRSARIVVPAFELEHVEIELCGSCERLRKIVRRPGVVLEY